MYLEAPAKLNIGLSIGNKLPNGYHTLQSIFVPISYYDIVEILPSDKHKTTLTLFGLPIQGKVEDNLILKVVTILKQKDLLDSNKHWDIYLHKQIPIGAGLGGGSSDAIAAFKLLEAMEHLRLSPQERMPIAMQLGSDCPFFLDRVVACVGGVGDSITPIHIPWDNDQWTILLFFPNIHIPTGWAYQQLDEYRKDHPARHMDLAASIQSPIIEWKNSIHNDFEEAIFCTHPVLLRVKHIFYTMGAEYAAMSGSGSTLFAIFSTQKKPSTAALAAHLNQAGIAVDEHMFAYVQILI